MKTEQETFVVWKEMVRQLAHQVMGETVEFKKNFNEFAQRKYVMEAMVRPFFGDSDEAYDYWLSCMDGACNL